MTEPIQPVRRREPGIEPVQPPVPLSPVERDEQRRERERRRRDAERRRRAPQPSPGRDGWTA